PCRRSASRTDRRRERAPHVSVGSCPSALASAARYWGHERSAMIGVFERAAWMIALAIALGAGLAVGAGAARGDATSRDAFHQAVTADAVRALERDLARARAERDAARAAVATAEGRAPRGGSLAQ